MEHSHPHDEHMEHPHPLPETDTPIRPYNHLIDQQADDTLFEQTFQGDDSVDNIPSFKIQLQDPVENGSKLSTPIVPGKRTGFVHYRENIQHKCEWDPNYEENPGRYLRAYDRMQEMDLIEKCVQIPPRRATKEELLRVHSEGYINKIETTSRMVDLEELEHESSKYDAVYFNESTYEMALYSAGSVTNLVSSVATGQVSNGFALTRPPGHHAMESEACGYCYFNNVAIAAEHCLNNLGLKRILIVDWDVHHGQATQRHFYKDPRVLYVSIHRYEFGTFWPELIESNYNFTGEGAGAGFNINVPLNETSCCDLDYLAIFQNLLLPVFYQFDPELIIVSAGYDAAIGCPEGEMLLTSAFYAHVTHALMALAGGRLAVVLEGGYCLDSLADSAAATLATLLGNAPQSLRLHYPIKQSVVESILDCISVLRPHFWPCLAFQGTFNRHEVPAGQQSEYQLEEEIAEGNFGQRRLPMIEYRGKIDMLPEKPTVYPTRDCYPIQPDSVREKWISILDHLRQESDAHYHQLPARRTCIIRVPEASKRHAFYTTHPERPTRIDFIWKYLKKHSLLDRCDILADNLRQATDDELLLAHSNQSLDIVKKCKTLDYKAIRDFEKTFDSIYMTKDTESAARLATGSLLQVVDNVMTGKSLNGAAIIRPPGHHASTDSPAGFCFFNNIAVAARYAIKKYALKRVMILDWDIHHGDGTQEIVKDDPNILFVSLHRFDNATFYPEKMDSNFNIGKNVINIPWSGGPMSDKEYLAAFFNVILPCAYNFEPELVLISAGFDAAKGDPLGEYDLSPAVYGQMTHLLSSLAGGRIVLALEGGYDLTCIAESMAECVKVLLGDSPPRLTASSIPSSPTSTSHPNTASTIAGNTLNASAMPAAAADNNHHFGPHDHLHASTEQSINTAEPAAATAPELMQKPSPPSKGEDLNVCAVETIKKVMAYHGSHWPALGLNFDLPLVDQYFYKQ